MKLIAKLRNPVLRGLVAFVGMVAVIAIGMGVSYCSAIVMSLIYPDFVINLWYMVGFGFSLAILGVLLFFGNLQMLLAGKKFFNPSNT